MLNHKVALESCGLFYNYIDRVAGNHSRAFAVPFPEPLVESFGEVLRRLQKLLLPSTDAPHNALHLFLPWRLLRLPRLEREITENQQFEYCVIN